MRNKRKMSLIDFLKEKTGRKLSQEEIEWAEEGKGSNIDDGSYIHYEKAVSDIPLGMGEMALYVVTMGKQTYTPCDKWWKDEEIKSWYHPEDGLLIARKTSIFDADGIKTKLILYSPRGRFFGKNADK